MTCFKLLLSAMLLLSLAPIGALADEVQPEAANPPDFVYTIQMGGLREGETTTWIQAQLDRSSAESVFQAGSNRIGVEDNAGFFEWRYGLCGFVRLKNQPDSSPIAHGPALDAALAHGKRYELGDVELAVYIPNADEFELKLWRLDAQGMSDAQLLELGQQQEDADADGFKDPPGELIGAIRWEIDCPDLGYIRDIEITPDVLREMQFGLPGHNGMPSSQD